MVIKIRFGKLEIVDNLIEKVLEIGFEMFVIKLNYIDLVGRFVFYYCDLFDRMLIV